MFALMKLIELYKISKISHPTQLKNKNYQFKQLQNTIETNLVVGCFEEMPKEFQSQQYWFVIYFLNIDVILTEKKNYVNVNVFFKKSYLKFIFKFIIFFFFVYFIKN